MHHIKSLLAGNVVVDIGQIGKAERYVLDRLTRKGIAAKWRGYWSPVAGAQFGIGPLKTCWALKGRQP